MCALVLPLLVLGLFLLAALVVRQEYNVSGVICIENMKMVPAPKRSKFKNRERNNGQIKVEKFLLNSVSMIMILLHQQPNIVKFCYRLLRFA